MKMKNCPTCQNEIPNDAPEGLCPHCLLGSVQEDPISITPAPDITLIEKAFPQLTEFELIGQGGMGFVYKAKQPELNRTIALKILSPELGKDPAFTERFAREARVLGKLNHPHIVTIFEHGENDRFFYLMMEYVDGVNLREAMSAQKFTPEQALAIIPDVCDALQSAHDQGIWHRDIKPENILLDQHGKVKIADFGIARIIGDRGLNFTLTNTGNALGSVAYMSPEQHENPHNVDHRADIYSLGVVIYEMLTGELPLGRFPVPSERSNVNQRIDELVLKTLEKERELRQQSASQVKTDIAHIKRSKKTNHSRLQTPIAPITKRAIILSLLTLILTVTYYCLWRSIHYRWAVILLVIAFVISVFGMMQAMRARYQMRQKRIPAAFSKTLLGCMCTPLLTILVNDSLIKLENDRRKLSEKTRLKARQQAHADQIRKASAPQRNLAITEKKIEKNIKKMNHFSNLNNNKEFTNCVSFQTNRKNILNAMYNFFGTITTVREISSQSTPTRYLGRRDFKYFLIETEKPNNNTNQSIAIFNSFGQLDFCINTFDTLQVKFTPETGDPLEILKTHLLGNLFIEQVDKAKDLFEIHITSYKQPTAKSHQEQVDLEMGKLIKSLARFTLDKELTLVSSRFTKTIEDQKKALQDTTKATAVFAVKPFTREYLEAKVDPIVSDRNFNTAINKYKLDQLFNTDKVSLLQFMKDSIKVQIVPRTDLVNVSVFTDNKKKSQQICYAAFHSYKDLSISTLEVTRNEAIQQFQSKLATHEAIVETHRKKLYILSKKFLIPYTGKHNKAADRKLAPKDITTENLNQFNLQRDAYERESAYLDLLKSAKISNETKLNAISSVLELHQTGWTPEIANAMEARKESN